MDTILYVTKRNGEKERWNSGKIRNAINGAVKEVKAFVPDEVMELILAKTVANFQHRIVDDGIDIEAIQDAVIYALMETGFKDVAIAYINYREHHKELRDANKAGGAIVDKFLNGNDWEKKSNATVTETLGGLILNNSREVTRDYWLNYVYDKRAAEAHKNGDMHIHDLDMLSGYCAGWSLKQLIETGITGVEGRISSAPASHLSTLCNQMVNFLGIMQNEWAGAQAFSSFDTYLAGFVKAENLTYKETKQAIQSFVFGINTPSRWGTQAPFTNITLDWVCPPDLKHEQVIVGGKKLDFTYGDCQAEMDMVNKAFIEIMVEGDSAGRGFQYPIPTYSITKDFDWSDTENNRLLFEMTAKYGTPYFSNYVNSDMEPSDVRSMCCRLRLDLRDLRKKSGGYFGSGESTGSVGVVTINMPRIAHLSGSSDEFYTRLEDVMDVAAASIKVKRRTVEGLLERGLYPYTKAYLGSFNNHFSTIGLVGMNEACLNAEWIGCDLTNEKAQQFTEEVLNFMRNKLSDYQEKYGDLYNLEATPAESTAYRFARIDKEKYPDIITASHGAEPFYTNSSHLPVGYTDDMFSALDIQDRFQPLYTSGTVFHAFLGEKLPDWQAAAKLVKAIACNYKLPYYTLSPTYSVCHEHGYISGEHSNCPKCGAETEVYSRITGYYRPVKNWNNGKAQEFKERKVYNVSGKCTPASPDITEVTPMATEAEKTESNELIIVSTTVCPKCKQLKTVLNSKGITFTEVLGDTPEGAEFCSANSIMQVPTCIYNGKMYPQFTILDVLK